VPENTKSSNDVVQVLNGRFSYLPAYMEPAAWLNADFAIELAGRSYRVDHYLQILPSKEAVGDIYHRLEPGRLSDGRGTCTLAGGILR
jgi:hypothetical protein